MVPQNWNLAIIDIKDCFFQIPLHPDDAQCFAFSVPTLNREAPRKRYHWKFLPQGMKNSPSICQWYLSSLLSPVRAAAGEAIILHYMDDVLVCAPNDDLLSHALDLTINSLVAAGFELQEEKIQRMPPWKYLGLEIGKRTIVPQKLVVKNNIKTLADVQQLCGSLNWEAEEREREPGRNRGISSFGPRKDIGPEPIGSGVVTSLLEKVQRLLNVKDTTFLVFHLVTFLYIVYSFSKMSHTLLNTVRQQIKAREQGDKSVTQAAANPTAIQAAAKPDSEAKTPAVAAVKKGKKHTDKTDRPVDDDSGEGSSMPPDTQSGVKPPDTQSEAEATDDTQSEAEPTDTKSEAKSTGTRSGVQPTSTRSGAQPAATTSGAQPTAARAGARPTAARAGNTIESFSLKDLRGLRKDYTRRPNESIISWVTGGSQDFTLVEADVSLTRNEWKRHPIVTSPEAPCILGIDFLRNGYFKDPKGFRWAFGIAAVETGGVKQLNTLPRLSENPSAVSLLRVEEQQVPIATSIVHRRQYKTTQDAVIPIHKMIRELESQGVVSKTHSPFNSPIWPVRKSDRE
ncbi:hypothetical protein DUI87_03031 [Hirundo rustica rustica]|uniref:ribonuclease H n=1 Tax=Hirundo rustica rustica TaxID=333673 RepID=A0A3M0L9U1_HIRRU|nr:hypothetical protein DUI87_03031 [Hirundo rustica rustica]